MEWVAAPVPEAAAVLERAGQPQWLAVLLARRGVADALGAEHFLRPSLEQLHDPFLLAGMEDAVERLKDARSRGERIAIVGDYDVDGITATAQLLAVFQKCGLEAKPVLPHRLREGYGFQPVHVERARELGCGLIVTADCGSSSVAAVEAALAAGIGVIVTDHHLPGCELPAGALHINPRQARCTYPFRDLAAAGLALKLCLALAARCGFDLDPQPLLRVACLGTIADLVPLHGENRVIAALGLTALVASRSQGLKALIQQSGMKPPFTAADVGFRLGPRLNAAGRLAEPDRALELLMSRDPGRAAELALELDSWNRERQEAESRVVEEARNAFAEREPLPPILVAWSEEWHKGVVGVAAGRIAKDFHRPTLLLAVEGESATGSGRSVPGLELHSFLSIWKERMARFGGHSQAVGLTVATDSLEELRREWEEAGTAWPEDLLAPRVEYELHLPPREITNGLLAQLAALEPFGQGNPRPLVRTGPLRLIGEPRTFGNGHLSARARGEDDAAVDLVGWHWAERVGNLRSPFEVLASVESDSYRGGPVLWLVASRPAASLP
ncbi:MAG TPA: single-stranded-DNA-specific exonuclease RecJ [Thermoanaerobaculia bacterium]|nr:single-stranded-DNA-specific exonuclease RecJ [Thermoanaerobaculia bacterium]